MLIGVGAWIVLGRRTRSAEAGPTAAGGGSAGDGTQRLTRSRTDSKILGVCGGIGMYLNTDPTIVRILFIIGAFVSAGLMVLLYFILAIVLPLETAAPPQTEG
jgi:phage shock protein C